MEITLITSDELEQGFGSYSNFKSSDVIKKRKIIVQGASEKKRKIIFISIGILMISSFFLMLSLLSLFFLLAVIGVGVFIHSYSTKFYAYEYYSLFKLKIFDSKSGKKPYSTNLIHSKIFLIDEKTAFLGSANFTYSGFKTHYETVIKVEDEKAIKDISKEIENLFNFKELKAKLIEELGKEIYE